MLEFLFEKRCIKLQLPRLHDLTIKSLGFAAPVVQLELQQNEVESRYPRLSVVWVLKFSF